jgi:drug/metabolite transporter (DMT)-like permease
VTTIRPTPVISPGRGTALIVFSSACFGFSGPLAKSAMDAGLSPQQVASVRICLAAVVLFAGTLIFRPAALRMRRKDLPVLVAYGVVGVAVVQLLYFVTVSRLPVGIAMLLEYMSPVLVTLWVRFVRRTAVARAVWLGVGLALVGLVLVAQVWQGASFNTIGIIAGLSTATCSACYFLLGERGVATADPVGMATWGLVIGAVAMVAVCPPWTIPGHLFTAPAHLGSLHLSVWVLLVAIALLSTVVAYLTGMAALRHLPSSVVSVLSLVEPVVATTLAWMVLGQALSPVQIAGGVVLLSGALIVQLTSRRRPVAEPTPVVELATRG